MKAGMLEAVPRHTYISIVLQENVTRQAHEVSYTLRPGKGRGGGWR